MSSATNCPGRDSLTAFLSGTLSQERDDEITRHLESCAICEAQAEQLEQHTDALIEALRRAGDASELSLSTAGFRDLPPPASADPDRTEPAIPAAAQSTGPLHLDGYRIVREIGRGGMGVVYEAFQHRLKRLVAIKMILTGTLAAAEERVRFLMEGELLARLSHPNFVQVYEVGTVELSPNTVQPYLVMEHVDGGTLKGKLSASPLSFRQSADFLRTLARAMETAHAQGVIHRDLKPANVLLARDGTLKITDFGLAKELHASGSLTPTGLTVGTPHYMAPEQAAGRSTAIGPATDVYSLGAILYEMLSGQPPFPGDTPMEVLLQVLDRPPAAPSRLRQGIPRDLETICLKCLQKDPHSRYASAGALAADLESWLENRPILARPVSRSERAWKWTQRHPLPASLLMVLALSLIVGSAISTYFGITATRREQEAQTALKAERWERYLAEIATASNALQANNIGMARRALEAAPAEHRNWEWRHLHSQLDGARMVLRGHDEQVWSVSFSADSKRLASASSGSIRIWDVPTGKQIAAIRPVVGKFRDAALSPDGRRVASGGERVRLWDAETGALVWEAAGGTQPAKCPVWSPNGLYLAGGGDDGWLRVLDAASGRELFARPCNPNRVPAVFSPNSRHVTVNEKNHTVHVWEVPTGAEALVLSGHTDIVNALAYSPDGTRLASGSIFPENEVRLWETASGRLIAKCSGHVNEVTALAFSPDGLRIASVSMDQTLRLWDGFTGAVLARLPGHTNLTGHLAFSPDGTTVVSASEDQTLRLWDPAKARLVAVLRGHTAGVGSTCFSPDGRLIASASSDGTVRLWNVELITRNGVLRHTNYVYDVALRPRHNGAAREDEVASVGWDGKVRLWNPTTGALNSELPHDAKILPALAYSPDGRQLAVVARDEGVSLWDLSSRSPSRLAREECGNWKGDARVAFHPDGDLMAWGGVDGSVRLWNRKSKDPIALLPGHQDGCWGVAFSPNGRQLASSGEDGQVRLWNVATRQAEAVLPGASAIYGIAYSPDGRLLAAGSKDNNVYLWNVKTHKRAGLLPHGGIVYGVAFNPDNSRLACACADNTIRLWDLAKQREVADLRGHEAYVHAVMFSPDGTRLVSGSGDFTVRVWDTLSAQERAAVK